MLVAVDFTIEQRIGAPVDKVHHALLDPDFLSATSGLPKLGGAQLLDERRDGNNVVRRVRYRFTGDLNAAVTRVIDRDKLTWVDESTDDLFAHTSAHTIVPDNYADRLSADYRTELVAADDDTTRRVTKGHIKVHMPLVGGRVERAIASGLQEYADAEAALVERWITA
jgi:hypothetical protein